MIEAGAIPIGKTNLDQFATGLNGTRSPYGACRNVFNPEYISGGSSSGSAVATAKGQVCFSLGTDTAGSGRVPAAFNNLVGYKPTPGWLSMHGVVPACRSLDCLSIFAFTAADAERVLEVSAGYDANDLTYLNIGEPKHIYIAANLDFPKETALRISEAITKLQESGELQRIIDKWH